MSASMHSLSTARVHKLVAAHSDGPDVWWRPTDARQAESESFVRLLGKQSRKKRASKRTAMAEATAEQAPTKRRRTGAPSSAPSSAAANDHDEDMSVDSASAPSSNADSSDQANDSGGSDDSGADAFRHYSWSQLAARSLVVECSECSDTVVLPASLTRADAVGRVWLCADCREAARNASLSALFDDDIEDY